MTTQQQDAQDAIQLSEDDVAYLLSVLRDPTRPQPMTTQQLIDALRSRTSR